MDQFIQFSCVEQYFSVTVAGKNKKCDCRMTKPVIKIFLSWEGIKTFKFKYDFYVYTFNKSYLRLFVFRCYYNS